MATYLWSELRSADKDGKPVTLRYGDTVTAAQVGGQDDFDRLVEEGVVRDYAPPKAWAESGNYESVSPVRFMLDEQQRLSDAAGGGPSYGGSVAAPPLEEILLGVGAGVGLKAASYQDVSEEIDVLSERIATLKSQQAEAEKQAKAANS